MKFGMHIIYIRPRTIAVEIYPHPIQRLWYAWFVLGRLTNVLKISKIVLHFDIDLIKYTLDFDKKKYYIVAMKTRYLTRWLLLVHSLNISKINYISPSVRPPICQWKNFIIKLQLANMKRPLKFKRRKSEEFLI